MGWYRHVTLIRLTSAFLTGICAQLESGSAFPIQASEGPEKTSRFSFNNY